MFPFSLLLIYLACGDANLKFVSPQAKFSLRCKARVLFTSVPSKLEVSSCWGQELHGLFYYLVSSSLYLLLCDF